MKATIEQLESSYAQLGSYRAVAREYGMNKSAVTRRLQAMDSKREIAVTPRRHIVIPDCQVKDGVDLSYLPWIGRYIASKQPDVIVCIGDFADMPSLSSYDKGKKCFEGRRYKADIEAAKRGMELLMTPIQKEMKASRWKPEFHLTNGNHEHRISRAIENDAILDGTISVSDLGYESWGWTVHDFLQPVLIDGIMYCHYFSSGVKGLPISNARLLLTKKHQTCIAGHLQGKDVAYAVKADGSTITGIICGSCYLHHENYLGIQGNNHYRGIIVLNEVRDGQFDEMFVSLNYLRNKYEHQCA